MSASQLPTSNFPLRDFCTGLVSSPPPLFIDMAWSEQRTRSSRKLPVLQMAPRPRRRESVESRRWTQPVRTRGASNMCATCSTEPPAATSYQVLQTAEASRANASARYMAPSHPSKSTLSALGWVKLACGARGCDSEAPSRHYAWCSTNYLPT